MIRLEPELHRTLKELAYREHRTLKAQVAVVIEAGLRELYEAEGLAQIKEGF